MTDIDKRLMTYEQAGIAAMLPGMIHSWTLQGQAIEEMKQRLAFLQNGHGESKKLERPKMNISEEGMKARKRAVQGYWASMSDEERSAEMRKRFAKRKDRATPVRSGPGGYWDRMTPEERKAEMKRRVAKQARMNGVTLKGMHPRDPAHPGHEAWLKKMSKVGKAGWARLTPEQRAERVAKQSAGHGRAA